MSVSDYYATRSDHELKRTLAMLETELVCLDDAGRKGLDDYTLRVKARDSIKAELKRRLKARPRQMELVLC